MENRASARILAADQRLIEISPAGWRLFSANHHNTEEAVLAEAAPGANFQYLAAFGSRLRLPEYELSTGAIERVVLGWSASDETWHLGLILNAELAEARGSRWCGLARWADPTAEVHRDTATEAGRALALALTRPLAIVPPRVGEARPAVDAPGEPPPPLPALPYTLDEWVVSAAAETQLRFALRAGWMRGRVIRAVLYFVWALGFLVLSITSLTAGIMLPTPEFLPWLGIVCAIWLVFLALRTLILMRRQPRWIEIDGIAQVVRGADWQIPAQEINSVFATQVVKLKTRGKASEQVRYGEINLLLNNGAFQSVVSQLRFDLKLPVQAGELPEDGSMLRLTEYSVRTTLQAAAVRIAHLLNVPAWNDRRID